MAHSSDSEQSKFYYTDPDFNDFNFNDFDFSDFDYSEAENLELIENILSPTERPEFSTERAELESLNTINIQYYRGQNFSDLLQKQLTSMGHSCIGDLGLKEISERIYSGSGFQSIENSLLAWGNIVTVLNELIKKYKKLLNDLLENFSGKLACSIEQKIREYEKWIADTRKVTNYTRERLEKARNDYIEARNNVVSLKEIERIDIDLKLAREANVFNVNIPQINKLEEKRIAYEIRNKEVFLNYYNQIMILSISLPKFPDPPAMSRMSQDVKSTTFGRSKSVDDPPKFVCEPLYHSSFMEAATSNACVIS